MIIAKTPWTKTVGAVGRVTFREILRDKLLYNIFLFAILILGTGFLAANLTYAQPERLVLDFGLSGLAISCGMIAILAGSGLLHRELERRTIHVALSRPISRPEFLLGKFFGLGMIIGLNWLLLSCALLAMTAFFASTAGVSITAAAANSSVFLALIFLLLQSLALGSMTIFFSTFSTPSISVIVSVGLYLVGSNISELRLASAKMVGTTGESFLKSIAAILPEFERFAPGTRVTYGLPFGTLEALGTLSYGILLSTFFLVAAGMVIRKREI